MKFERIGTDYAPDMQSKLGTKMIAHSWALAFFVLDWYVVAGSWNVLESQEENYVHY